MSKVLIIDDEEKLRKLLVRIIALEGIDVTEADTVKAGIKKLEDSSVDVILCDVKLPDGNGVDLVKELKRISPVSEIILLTAYGNVPDGVQAIKNGAFDYIIKGDDNDKIIPLLNRALEKVQLQKRVTQLEKKIGAKYSFDNIVGNSNLIKQAIELAKKVASSDTTVLLTGETGTGKEIFAQSIHQASGRRLKQFVAVNCSAISKDILESELFGYKAGAFTGANKDKKGLLEEANGGTFFLDEIGELPLELQPKLLRVIETGEFIRPGDTKTHKVNVRIITATNRDLKKEIEAGRFRQDLFYRLSVFQIALPALRERVKDIPLLANHFLKIYDAKTNKKITGISDDVMQLLMKYDYPGNIRELKNIIERAVILEDTDQLLFNSLPIELQSIHSSNEHTQLSAFDLASAEKLHIQKVLNYTNGNKTEAARLLHIGLTTLYRKIEEYKIAT
jgi:two-component system, NtrC family, response regulator